MRPLRLRILVAVVCGLLPAVAAAQPAEVQRVLRTFDFEERALGNPEDLPMHWVKVTGSGLPHYVNGRLTTDDARGGKYSFRFDLNGGGLIYRYPYRHLKVQAGAHYRIEGYVRTTRLPHARTRLTAYFADIDGNPLVDSVRHSELYGAKGSDEGWTKLSIEVSVDGTKAAWLVLELGLLQPMHYAPSTLGPRTLNVQDIKGTAWFDDLTVSQVPRVTISTEQPGNVFRRGEPLRLQVRVDDRFTDDLAARLVVHDASGKTVYQRSGALDMATAAKLGPGQRKMTLELPELPAGWYRASLLMSSQGQTLGSQTLALIQLADAAPPARPDRRFGFVATSLPFHGWDELPRVLPLLSAGRVKLAVWSDAGDIQEMNAADFDGLLQRLGELGITPTACLVNLPPAITQRLLEGADRAEVGKWGGGEVERKPGALPSSHLPTSPPLNNPTAFSSWPHILTADPKEWQPQLAFLISRHANHLDRWQLGADGSEEFVTNPKMRQVYADVYKEFTRLVQNPDLAMPWPAWYELDGDLPATVALSVPSSVVLPSQLPLYMQDLRGKQGHHLSLTLDVLDPQLYGREVQIRDLAQRVVYALSAGGERIDLPLPFTVRREGDGAIVKEPQEMLLVMRTLITTLGGTTYRGKVPIADGVEAFLFDRNGQGILALWDRGAQAGERELALNLGQRPVSVDLWGNITPLFQRAGAGKDGRPGQVKLSLGPMPIFLVDVDAQLAQTRASVALDRPLIESSFQPHSRRLRFTNAYRQAVTGTLKLKAPQGWTLNPPVFSFALNPGETFDRELTIEIPYNSVAGKKTIAAEFSIPGEANGTFSVPILVSLGLTDVGMQTVALRDGSGAIIVQQLITNYGERPISYDAFALCPGQARQERMVSGLGPGKTTMKRYRFTGANLAPGAKVRVGLKEINGTRILNEEVPVQ